VGGTTYAYVVFIDTDRDLVLDGGETVVKQVLWSAYDPFVGLDMTEGDDGDGMSFNGPDNGLAFGADGLPKKQGGAMAGGTVFLVHGETKKKLNVVVATAGNIRIARP